MRGSDSFAVLLRCRRCAAGLTQEELAERAHVSARTVSDMERGISGKPRRDTLALLAEALALKAAEREEFEASARQAEPNGRASVKSLGPDGDLSLVGGGKLSRHASSTNLPRALTSFIGREREQAALVSLLAQVPLLTLTGAGGCGKTRLALCVAGDCLALYPDGIRLVELAPLASATLIPQAVAAALGVNEEPGRPLIAGLTTFLRPKRLLLVLDNCEHLVAACAELAAALLRDCPMLQILATSREALGIAGEHAWKVPSLSLPDPQQPRTPVHLIEAEAVQLFVERARAVRSAFTLTERNGNLVAQVCRRLDGIPLAIELAAARLSAISLENLADRLDDRFRLLTGGSRTALPRQQTLRATLDWSHALLDEAERAVLRRLAVFAGGWTLEAAELVCASERIPGEAVVDLLTGLVNKSLVVLDDEEDTGKRAGRYRLLETVRQYAVEQLIASGEATVVRGRHLEWYLAWAEQAEQALSGPEQGSWMDRLDSELENLRLALHEARETGEPERGLRLATALARFWYNRGYSGEGRRWLEEFLALFRKDGAGGRGPGEDNIAGAAKLRAWALAQASWMAALQIDTMGAQNLAEQSLTLSRESGDLVCLADVLSTCGMVARDMGDFVRSAALLKESAALWSKLDLKYRHAGVLRDLAITMVQHGKLERASTLARESTDLLRDLGVEWDGVLVLFVQSLLAWEQGDLGGAIALGERCLAQARNLGDNQCSALILSFVLGQVAREQDDLERAIALCEESLALGRDLGDIGVIGWASLSLGLAAREQGDLVRARAALGEGLSLFWARGMKWFMARCLAGLVAVIAEEGEALRAARLAGATEALVTLMDAPLPRGERAGYESAKAAARAALGGDRFSAAWATGQALLLGEAVTEALADSG